MTKRGFEVTRYYDKSHNRLVYCEQRATPQFWDQHWDVENFQSAVKGGINNSFILKHTRMFLRSGRVLEGGCGMGGNVYCLHHNGYDAFGVDFAKETVGKINRYFPELKVTEADVRSLPFEDDFFDGYWSLGVIEHFYEGYNDILKEMKRVVKKGGYVFLTFPYMSPLRELKAKIRLYPEFENNSDLADNFYQFALDHKSVIKEFNKEGFELVHSKSWDGIKGFKDEVRLFKPPLQRLYDYGGNRSGIHALRNIFSKGTAHFSAHMMLLVFKRL